MQISNADVMKSIRNRKRYHKEIGLRHDDQPITPVDVVDIRVLKTRDEIMGHGGTD